MSFRSSAGSSIFTFDIREFLEQGVRPFLSFLLLFNQNCQEIQDFIKFSIFIHVKSSIPPHRAVRNQRSSVSAVSERPSNIPAGFSNCLLWVLMAAIHGDARMFFISRVGHQDFNGRPVWSQ